MIFAEINQLLIGYQSFAGEALTKRYLLNNYVDDRFYDAINKYLNDDKLKCVENIFNDLDFDYVDKERVDLANAIFYERYEILKKCERNIK